jgi:hypothetical protein
MPNVLEVIWQKRYLYCSPSVMYIGKEQHFVSTWLGRYQKDLADEGCL